MEKIAKGYNVQEKIVIGELSYLTVKLENKNWSEIYGYFMNQRINEKIIQCIVHIITGNNMLATSRQCCFDELINHYLKKNKKDLLF